VVIKICPEENRAEGAHEKTDPERGESVHQLLVRTVAREERVHGFWVNETDVFFYDGDTRAFNQFLDAYGKLKSTALQVVLHPGARKARSPWDKAERNIPVTWSLHASFDPLDHVPVPNAAGRFYTRIDVWLGSRLKLEDLRIPANIDVASGGEIERFIAERRRQQKK
jgi:hypothetical protein